MRIVCPEFGSIDRQRIGHRVLACLQQIDRPDADGVSAVFDWSDQRWLRIQNYVGIIQVPGLTLEIVPKAIAPAEAVIDPPVDVVSSWWVAQKNLLFMLTVAGHLPFEERDIAGMKLTTLPLFEALVAVFARRLLTEFRKGLDRSYVTREENLPRLRGKLLTTQHATVNVARRDRLFVRYDEFVTDTQLNRVIKAACRRLLSLVSMPRTQQLIRECLIELSDVEDVQVRPHELTGLSLHRNNERFESALQFCKLVLQGRSPQPEAGGVRTFSLLFPMEKVFEAFVTRMMVKHCNQLGLNRRQIAIQSNGRLEYLVFSDAGRGRFQLRPDLLILNVAGGIRTIVDTKWKRLKGDVEDVKNGVNQSDMYQLFAYAHRFPSIDNVLVYPAAPDVTPKRYVVRDGTVSRTIRIELLNLERDLAVDRLGILSDLRRTIGHIEHGDARRTVDAAAN